MTVASFYFLIANRLRPHYNTLYFILREKFCENEKDICY